ncbi:MAG: radical SAM protein [Syntrophales bacterium]|nr:radical SAM protein [Syntrophales bacterium]
MKVLLVSANTEQINIPPLPLGLNCVAAAAGGAGHEIKVIDLMAQENNSAVLRREIGNFRPDVIGVSVRNIDDQNIEAPQFLLDRVKEIANDIRKASDAPLVLGGAGYSIFPESALEYLEADMGIQGEGEKAFPLLIEKISAGADLSGTPGLFLRGRGLQGPREFQDDLDAFPLPDPALSSVPEAGRRDIYMPFQTRRGCPFDCSYCSTPVIEGCALRMRSPGPVIDSISRYCGAGFGRFYFVDNIFNVPSSYAGEICSGIIARKLKISWRCIYYPGEADVKLVSLMASAGCSEVSLGFESGSGNILHRMNKKFSSAQVRRASDILREHGIRRMGFLMLGGPGETEKTAEESLAFADSLGLDSLKITIGIRIYPGTSLARCAVEDGLISPDDNLLFPKFYVVRGMYEWLQETVQAWKKDRPCCTD